MAYKKLTSFYR